MWLALFLITIVVCITVNNMWNRYLEAKYPKRDEYNYREDEDDPRD